MGLSNSTEASIYVTQISANIVQDGVICDENSTVDLQLFVVGGMSPYSYLWNNGAISAFVSGAGIGNYIVTVVDGIGCTAVVGHTVEQLVPTLNVEITSSECVDSTGAGWLSLNITGGSAPYTYTWNTNEFSPTISVDQPGLYHVVVTDNHGCSAWDYDTLENNLCATNLIGNVYHDLNENCTIDEGEAMTDVLVRATPGPYYSYTNESGQYKFFLDPGSYVIDVANRPLFEITCPVQGYQSVTITDIYDTINDIDIGMMTDVLCSNLQVSMSSGSLRPCMQGFIYVTYQNIGTITAENSYVELELDELLSYSSSSIPLTSSEGNTLRFDVGNIVPGGSGYFHIIVDVECNTWLIGTTVCSEATIFPNDPCETDFGDWDYSSVMVEGYCQENTNACFTITNTGDFGDGDMQNEQEYRIFANDTLVFVGTFQLNGGEELEICWPTSGRAIRLEADQHPEHPGNSHPQETIENCGDPDGTSLGYITTVPYDDDDEFVDVYCRVLTGSYDPNDKIVQPSGVTSNHYIDDDYTLNYQINFQNTGTDTAFTVVITDTISAVHDMSTFVNGVSSHPSTLEITGQGILKWTFENILLPDSTTNEPESHGFVTYSIKLNEMTEEDYGTLVENTAAIFFDYNEPVITNTTLLTFWELPIVYIAAVEQMTQDETVSVYPNPASNVLYITSENMITDVTLLDLNGKIILKYVNYTDCEKIDVSKVPTGLYFLKLIDDDNNTIIKKIILE